MTPDVLHEHTRRKKNSVGIVKADGLSFQQEKQPLCKIVKTEWFVDMEKSPQGVRLVGFCALVSSKMHRMLLY